MIMPQVYSWTGENNYIVRGAASNLVIGSSDGRFGIWLDESFNQGRSQVQIHFFWPIEVFAFSTSNQQHISLV